MLTPLERASESAWMPAWLRHEHLARYAWATEFAVGRKVIDAACGTGYGTQQVAVSAVALVDGFDVSMEAIAEARRLHASAGVCFEVADVTRLPRPDHIYDLFLSFETIEHVPDDITFLKEAARVLKPGGTFVCSTPNRMVTNPGISAHGKPFNPFHVREYTEVGARIASGQVFFFGNLAWSDVPQSKLRSSLERDRRVLADACGPHPPSPQSARATLG